MKAEDIGRAIGAASLTFGIFDMAMGHRLGPGIGAGRQKGAWLFRVAGAREVVTGVAGLIAPNSPLPVRWRLAGDAVDLAALGYVATRTRSRRKMAFLALGIVAAVAAVDLIGARALSRQRPA